MEELAIKFVVLIVMVGIGLAFDRWVFPWEDVADGDKPAKYVPLHEQFRK
ncbi:hypothetical protein CE91St62_24110 [Lachnospiraceae bacterium]|nr:hypothetical protein [Extibacter sp. GGCC_0201]MBO1721278.1 hypothetical protein [Extibacter sp. GGCC_0201]BDF34346.1 hypothetical protein CE91St61_24210 [Lachnospiraceae bacterium]BDF38350.1 hypothetical protein CE91St62_24110 [Lachnospiraceae bacterium]